jgi:arsenite-transporting ATPase
MAAEGSMEAIAAAPRYLFFTGKGGVGKTSVACASALALARAGRRVLLVSTDPASNLDEVLEAKLGTSPVRIAGVTGLAALNLDPEAAARAYRERVVGPYRGLLPEASVRRIEEQLSGACTVEIAAFDEFSKLLGDPDATAEFDHVVFDTAPTGHTLRLLELPAAWTNYIDQNRAGVSCLGPLSGLSAQRDLYTATRRALTDSAMTRVVLVTRPEEAALAEAERTRAELAELGVQRQHLVVNGVFVGAALSDRIAVALEQRGAQALANIAPALARLPRTTIPLFAFAPVGIARLGALLGDRMAAAGGGQGAPFDARELDALVEELASQPTGVVLTMGKGGVGKTTIAKRVARELARRGLHVHLTTTDPAGRTMDPAGRTMDPAGRTMDPAGRTTDTGAFDDALDGGGVRVSRIDPVFETRKYAEEVLQAASPSLDEAGRALLEEELRSPCTEEVAVFRAFARVVAEGESGVVVVDTAPTGHTLLLLDAAEAYHREVSRSAGQAPEAVRLLLPRLRDPRFARVLIVTLPEATPVHEAKALQEDLARAGIEPFAWVVNQSLLPLELTDPTLSARRAAELEFLDEVRAASRRFVLVPFSPEPATRTERVHEAPRESQLVSEAP